MKTLHAVYVLCLCVLFLAPAAPGQNSMFGGGGYLSIGGESAYRPHINSNYLIPIVGIYGEWLKPRVHPGLDLRYRGGTFGEHGTLVGPRVSASIAQNFIHPYAEALFGPNEVNLAYTGATLIEHGQPVTNMNRDGVTIQGVVGVDLGPWEHYKWRIEFSQSRFSGIPDSHPHAVTTGLVIHF